MLPPPAPTSAMSIVGIRSSSPAPRIRRLPADIEPPTSYSRPREMAPSSISDAFAVVPPMSNASRLSMPSCCPMPRAATTPAAGPDSSAKTGRCLRVVRGHDAAGRLHDLQRPVEPDPVEAGPDPVDVRGHQRPHVGVDDGGRGALVLALLAQDLARERDVHLRQLLGEDRAEAPLVLGVEVGVEEADGHGLDARAAQAGGELAALVLVELADDGAVGGDALVQLEAEVALDERRRLAPEEVVHVRDPQPAQLEHVAEAGGRDERRRAAAPLEHGVRRHRRAVDDLGDGPPAARPPTASTTARS